MESSPLDVGNLFRVDGLVAVVTGGGTGIGLMMAKALEHNGAKVYIVGRREDVLEEAAKQAKHNNLHPFPCDITSKPSIDALISHIGQADGHIDLLIANAGTSGPVPQPPLTTDASLADLRAALWDRADPAAFTATFATNVTGVLLAVGAFLELLDAGNRRMDAAPRRGRSQVLVTGAIGAFNRVSLGGFAYGPSKAAVTHMAKQLATALGPHGIRVNVLAPGLYPSDMATEAMRKYAEKGWPRTQIPAERAGDGEDMAGAVLFLASRAGAYVDGNVLVTDGGVLGVRPSSY